MSLKLVENNWKLNTNNEISYLFDHFCSLFLSLSLSLSLSLITHTLTHIYECTNNYLVCFVDATYVIYIYEK